MSSSCKVKTKLTYKQRMLQAVSQHLKKKTFKIYSYVPFRHPNSQLANQKLSSCNVKSLPWYHQIYGHARHGYFGSTLSRQNTNNGSTKLTWCAAEAYQKGMIRYYNYNKLMEFKWAHDIKSSGILWSSNGYRVSTLLFLPSMIHGCMCVMHKKS